MSKVNKKITEWHNVTREVFVNEIAPLSKPAIFRGFVKDWPLVNKALESNQAASDHIRSFDQGVHCQTMLGSPEIEGKLFYQKDMKGLNFEVKHESISDSLSRIFQHLDDKKPPALFSGSIPINKCLPKLQAELHNPLLGNTTVPKIWIGNAITVQTHYDASSNIACVAAGRRRFTLFPPEQISNLYPGPIEFTPAGQPVSMVQLDNPDLEKYPKFKTALAEAEVAELSPGDAIYMPPLWWHHVQSLTPFNILVNYWWDSLQRGPDAPYTGLVHGLMSIRGLPEADRMAWRAMFDHYVFQTSGDPVAHLPPENRGVLGEFTPKTYNMIKGYFINSFDKDQQP